MHRSWPAAQATGGGAVAEGGEGAADARIIHWRAGVEEVAYLDAEETGLIGGLVGAPAAQFWRSVGGQEDEGKAGFVGLHHRGVPVGRGAPGGGEQGHRATAGTGQAEGEEGGAALVEDGGQRQGRAALGGQDHRRGAGAGGEDQVLDPTDDEPIQ